MKKMRFHICAGLWIGFILVVLGVFFDLKLSTAIACSTNEIALGMSAVGIMIGYCALSIVSGGYFSEAIKKETKIFLKVIYFIASIAILIITILYAGREFFGENGFYGAMPVWFGYIISFPFMFFSAFLGFYLFKKSDLNKKWLLLTLFAISAIIIILIGNNLLKPLMSRPRFRILDEYGIPFYNMWERCFNSKELMAEFGISKEEFKSFPSVHVLVTAFLPCIMVFLPFIDKKYEKVQVPLFYLGLVWTLYTGYNRILAGAHFLTDVGFGMIITFLFMFVLNEVISKLKAFNPKESVS